MQRKVFSSFPSIQSLITLQWVRSWRVKPKICNKFSVHWCPKTFSDRISWHSSCSCYYIPTEEVLSNSKVFKTIPTTQCKKGFLKIPHRISKSLIYLDRLDHFANLRSRISKSFIRRYITSQTRFMNDRVNVTVPTKKNEQNGRVTCFKSLILCHIYRQIFSMSIGNLFNLHIQ